jgi:hypothetical protein
MRNLFLILFCMAFSSAVAASEEDYKLCTIGGYFSGTNDKFLSGLAAHIAGKKHIFGDPICDAAWANGFRVGEKLTKTGKIKDPSEREIIQQATAFSSKIYETISSRVKF